MLKVQQPEALRQPRQHHSRKPGDLYCLQRDSAIRISALRTELEYWSTSTFLFRVGEVMYSHHICITNQWTASHSHHKFSFFHSIATRHRPYGINLIFPQALVSKWNLYMPLHVGGFTTNETERGKKKIDISQTVWHLSFFFVRVPARTRNNAECNCWLSRR